MVPPDTADWSWRAAHQAGEAVCYVKARIVNARAVAKAGFGQKQPVPPINKSALFRPMNMGKPIPYIGFFHPDSEYLYLGSSTFGLTAYRSSTTNDLAIKSRTPPSRSIAVSSAVMSFTTVV